MLASEGDMDVHVEVPEACADSLPSQFPDQPIAIVRNDANPRRFLPSFPSFIRSSCLFLRIRTHQLARSSLYAGVVQGKGIH